MSADPKAEVQKALRELHEGPDIAIAGPAHQSVVDHGLILSPLRCQETGAAFKERNRKFILLLSD